ncbi:MAG: lipoyl(octanoyl) transferase LipB [Alphaproteobacteria bacterium]
MVNSDRSPAPEWRISAGLIPYTEAVAEMEARVAAIAAGQAPELIWLLEHPPLYTAGTSAKAEELLTPDLLPVYPSGRGGRYTYHGPGQRIAYAMLNLRQRDLGLRAYSQTLESWAIATLAKFGVAGERRAGRVGIWVPRDHGREDKIAAIGVRVRHGVAYHGLSINLDPDLKNYRGIVPCGIPEDATLGVTSLADLGVKAHLRDVDAALMACFEGLFPATG